MGTLCSKKDSMVRVNAFTKGATEADTWLCTAPCPHTIQTTWMLVQQPHKSESKSEKLWKHSWLKFRWTTWHLRRFWKMYTSKTTKKYGLRLRHIVTNTSSMDLYHETRLPNTLFWSTTRHPVNLSPCMRFIPDIPFFFPSDWIVNIWKSHKRFVFFGNGF